MEINTKLDLMIMQSLAQLINNIIDIFSLKRKKDAVTASFFSFKKTFIFLNLLAFCYHSRTYMF